MSFHIARFSQFLDMFGAEPSVVDEVRKEEAEVVSPTQFHVAGASRRFLAVSAVGRWAQEHFSAPVQSEMFAVGPDLLIERSGSRLGISVIVVRDVPLETHHNSIVDRAYVGYMQRQKLGLDRFGLAIVTSNTEAAHAVLGELTNILRRTPPLNVYVGYLQEDEFVLVKEVNP